MRRTLMVAIGCAAVLSVVLSGCGDGGDLAAADFDNAELNDNRARIQQIAQAAALIVVGTVQSVGDAPPAWSGIALADQEVVYTVTQVVKGTYTTGTSLTVGHVLVGNSRHAGNQDTAVGLDPAIFTAGNQLILLVQAPDGTGAEDISENFSAIPHSAQNLAAVNALIGQ